MPSYSPELIQTMRAALDEAMTKVPVDQATPGIKAHMAELILKAAADGQTSYVSLLAAASNKFGQFCRRPGEAKIQADLFSTINPTSRLRSAASPWSCLP